MRLFSRGLGEVRPGVGYFQMATRCGGIRRC